MARPGRDSQQADSGGPRAGRPDRYGAPVLKLLKLARQVVTAVVVLIVAGLLFANRDRLFSNDDSPDVTLQEVLFTNRVVSLPGVRQVLVVSGATAESTQATVTGYEIIDGIWTRDFGPVGAMVGRSGFRDPGLRTEGDGTTPIGIFPLTAAFGREGAPGGTEVPYTPLEPGDCWISDVADPAYNRWVRRSPCAAPNVDLYDRSDDGEAFHRGVLLEFNTDLRVPNQGSAIFIHHVERDGSTALATYGGVALGSDDLDDLIGWLKAAENPVAVMGPAGWITSPPA